MRHDWRKTREPVNTADDWLMTYADMITLLLCFFVVFVSVAVHKKDQPQQVQVPVEQSAADTNILAGNLPFQNGEHAYRPQDYPVEKHARDGSVSVPVTNLAEDKPQPPPPPPLPTVTIQAPTLPEPLPPAKDAKTEFSPPQIVDQLKTKGSADLKRPGDRITIMEMSSATFFASGSAILSESGKAVLKNVAVNIKSDKFRDYEITVEGHTDDTPIKTAQFPSNWELSTARASAVVHFFLDDGLPAQRLRAAGYADTFPKAPNRDKSGYPLPANRALNRRVVIKLEKIERPDEQGLHQGNDGRRGPG